jgi:hypothetical protein
MMSLKKMTEFENATYKNSFYGITISVAIVTIIITSIVRITQSREISRESFNSTYLPAINWFVHNRGSC